MSGSTVVRGAWLLVVLAVIDILGSLLVPPPPDAPDGAELVGAGLGVLALVPVLVWFGRRRSGGGRVAMWVAVVLRMISALLPILGLGQMPAWFAAITIALLVAAVVAVLLVRPALGRAPATV